MTAGRSCAIPGVILIEPTVHRDDRGVFVEVFNSETFASVGIERDWHQDSVSRSSLAGTIRGLHFQRPPHAQAKLVRVSRGGALDVVVDLRVGSPTYGETEAFLLSADRWEVLFVPEGLAHGICTLEPDTEISYKVSDRYSPAHEGGIRWDDPTLAIAWPLGGREAVVSEKDASLPFLDRFESPFIFEEPA